MKAVIRTFGAISIALVLSARSQAQAPSTNGLVASYPLNGNANDTSGNGNNGQITAGSSFVPDRFGNPQGSLENTNVITPGTVAGVLTTVAQNPGNVFSLSAWFKASPAATGQLITFGDTQTGHNLNSDRNLIVSGGQITFYVYPGHQVLLTATNNVADGKWHTAVATLSEAGMRLYLDGVMVTNNPSVTTAQSYTGYWQLARIFGDVDDVRLYNRALSDSEVRQMYLYESQTHYDGQFQIVAGAFTWFQAEADAVSRGGHLATFCTQAKWNALVNEFGSRIVVDAWIGGYQPPGSPEPAGNWTWITREPWTFSDWRPGEPNNQGGIENSLIVAFAGVAGWSNAGWNDADGSVGFSYVLESTPQNFLGDGLVAYYPFNGNANDMSGNGNNGTLVGTDWRFATDRFGTSQGALFLNTTSPPSVTLNGAYVSAPRSAALDFGGDFTLSVWVNYSIGAGSADQQTLISNGSDGDGYMDFAIDPNAPYIGGNDRLAFSWGGSNAASGVMAPRLNVWRQVVARRSGTTMTVYENGVALTNNVSAVAPLNSPTIWLGRWQPFPSGSATLQLFGAIDDVRMYNRALSSSEVQQLYAYESAPQMSLRLVGVINAVQPSFTRLMPGVNYQLQISSDLKTWYDEEPEFTATSMNMVYPLYYDVGYWSQLFFRLRLVP